MMGSRMFRILVILAAIMGANVLERYPHIRIAFGESCFDTEFFQRYLKLVISSSIKKRCGNKIVPRLQNIRQREELGGLA